MATVIKTNGEPYEVKPKEGRTKLTLEQLQAAVGGLIEVVRTHNMNLTGLVVFCNEEGLLLGLPPNVNASLFVGSPLVGDVIVCDANEVE
jgi:hypothetical protein